MISEAQLTDLLERTAEQLPVPEDRTALVRRRAERAAGAVGAGGYDELAVRRSRRHRFLALGAAAAAVVVIGAAVVLPSHGGGSSSSTSSKTAAVAIAPGTAEGRTDVQGSAPIAAAAPVPAGAAAGGAATGEAGGGQAAGTSTTGSAPSVAGPRVVQTASIALQVGTGKVASALDQLRGLVTGDGGFVASSDSTLIGADPSGTVTLRVPYAAYSQLRNALISGTYGHVLSVQETGQDVTAQYTDLGARLTALQGTRAAFLALLTKANTIGDTLAVQQQISTVQQQIESLQGQLKVLADQSDDATLTVTVAQNTPAVLVPPTPRAGFDRAWHDARAGFDRAVERLVADSGTALVVVVVLGAAAVIVRLAWRFGRRRLV